MPEEMTKTLPAKDTQTAQARQFVNFRFFRIDPAWRRLSESQKEKDRQEFLQVAESFRQKGVTWLSYSLIGIRGDAEFLLWRIADKPELLIRQLERQPTVSPIRDHTVALNPRWNNQQRTIKPHSAAPPTAHAQTADF